MKKQTYTGILFIISCLLGTTVCLWGQEISTSTKSLDNASEKYVPGQILVKFSEYTFKSPSFKLTKDSKSITKTGIASIDQFNEQFKVSEIKPVFKSKKKTARKMLSDERIGINRWHKFLVPVDTDIPKLVETLKADTNIESVEPNWYGHFTATPNDIYYSFNWGHENRAQLPSWQISSHNGLNVGTMNADADLDIAWDYSQGYGSSNVIIAIIDTGVDWDHPDLAANIWENTDDPIGESGAWPVWDPDDDLNGYVDDVRGWDFINGDNDPSDGLGHGTCCAGIACAIDNNNIGVVGVAPNCKIMPLKAAYDNGTFVASSVAEAIEYADDNGASIISMSFGGPFSNLIEQELQSVADNGNALMFASTGNNNASAILHPASSVYVKAVGAASPECARKRSSDNTSEVNPGVYTDPNGVTTDHETWWGSNYGINSQDAADAVDILGPTILPTTDIAGASGYADGDNNTGGSSASPDLDANYTIWFNGTSCSCPFVAGVAALIKSQNPTWTPTQIWNQLRDTATDVINVESGEGWDRYSGYGMVNAAAALCNSNDYVLPGKRYYGTQSITATNTIRTTFNTTIMSGASITFQAGSKITLTPGFKAHAGSSFNAHINP